MTSFLVTGVGGPAGRNVAGLLLERGLRVVGTDMCATIDFPGLQFYPVPVATDPAFLDSVAAIARREQVDRIIPTVSEELPVFASRWSHADRFPVLVSSALAVQTADDKLLTAQALSSSGVPVPRYVLPSGVHSLEEVARLIGWPCISKPRVGRGGREVTWHPEQDWEFICNLDDHYILQEFASGTDYAPNVYVHRDGSTQVVVLEKTELKEGIVGNAKSVRRVDIPEVAAVASSAALSVGLTGPLDIDIRCRCDGTPVVLEINARFGANIRSAPEILDAMLSEAR